MRAGVARPPEVTDSPGDNGQASEVKVSVSNEVAAHLPYLRRYARALTGSQRRGDRLVVNCLEALVDDAAGARGDLADRTALYRLLHVIWSASLFRHGHGDCDAAPDGQISRAALLLSAMEGFDGDDVATILGIERGEVNELLDAAVDDLYSQPSHEVMIVEDEAIIALDLKMIVEEAGHRVTHIARTRSDAVRAGLNHMPDLVLADVQLADGSSGLDAVRDLLRESTVPVIFVTAYPERLLTGERPEPAFIVTKPFAAATIRAAVWQAIGTSAHAVHATGAGD